MDRDDDRPEPTHGDRPEPTDDARATPMGPRRGYARTITIAMAVLVAAVIVWYVVAQFLFL